ncbi:FAD-binding oxidoreductase [Curvibacter sp. RS43]|uniref:NAD(P)/FAD-dependent oxidoreductase n=1 Tax=Curvibacter microcysteis TaxID=3026419 RepID=UPI00235E3364|nr:FAD-binding oxidoreductase [Curvibacter sp. RS43]MDD0811231.1 FAD-binding oxidoreductase [Curvibacter sp. RS43]
MSNTVAVLGAGMVGVSCALELQRRGFQVTLYERRAPGQETSYGNAGVIARSSLIPFNHPGLWASLPNLLRNQSPQFRYSPSFLARHLGWATGFLARARPQPFEETARALDGLIRLSTTEHQRLLGLAGERHRLRDNGWLFLYRSQAAYDAGAAGRAVFARYGVRTQCLDAAELQGLEPSLKPGLFPRTLWVQDSASVDSPGAVTEAYARLFVAQGGRLLCQPVQGLARSAGSTGWQLTLGDGHPVQTDRVVVALGPWSAGFLKEQLGLRVPMAFERGYHRHFGAEGGATLGRPVYDTGGAYVLSPMAQGLRLTSGVELTDLDAPRNPLQLALAEAAARQAFPLGAGVEAEPWMGSRPTLPDSRPMIGEAAGQPGLWLAFGHQHIGFSTGPGTAVLLGALMAGQTPAIDASPFRPERFLR